ncbi:hypothetical protein COT48_05695 [Candidatus Woesearchaeota archaeon CG08_land_8_20_14_0_20_47_9]|nr:MAG: hypothetical protein AUJ69_03900 [Candidatus Woesearchaeota archaeon CG1_02_47_18]PIN72637.1 MAG: hypothetical protein COV22_02710 [Candidatus Woesearchaeota archaeon CG10_big_fil_rev_8_21_14_0_10_47_5]PIO03246.1 MAG: hypothetical protein COT48_05695 [Candidatus Woesearchaeota archaeon CG08_land_8_20_14_0_20_47_9]HII30251.1 hypothetical protein [Candidatus Woesearchaeota archaeon]
MAKKRDKLGIISDMLASIQERNGVIKPTHLMYRSNLSHAQLKSYLEELVGKRLVERIQKNEYEYISITNKGCAFLQKLKEINEFERTFGI